MKKLVLTVAIVLGMTFGASAQYFAKNDQPNQGGGLFGRGMVSDEIYYGAAGAYSNLPLLPIHNQDGNQDAPLGSGALLLIGFGAAYAASKRRKE